MKIHCLTDKPDVALSQSLSRFETQFLYPLGENRQFRIDHGDDYPLFFRAMGRGCCFVAEQQETILGILGVALREFYFPDGTLRTVMYVGDLKIAPEARGGYVLYRLLRALSQWSHWETHPIPVFSVVMEGNALTPKDYTGRLGIPAFQEIAKVMILRIPCLLPPLNESQSIIPKLPQEKDYEVFRSWTSERYTPGWTRFTLRSKIEPQWFMFPEGSACGLLEDTRRAKKLRGDQNEELVSAHLSYFAYRQAIEGQQLLDQALRYCASISVPFLFVSIPLPEISLFREWILERSAILAPASVYGVSFETDALWQINTSEI